MLPVATMICTLRRSVFLISPGLREDTTTQVITSNMCCVILGNVQYDLLVLASPSSWAHSSATSKLFSDFLKAWILDRLQQLVEVMFDHLCTIGNHLLTDSYVVPWAQCIV